MKTFLAPMAGYTDRVLRDFARDFGADVVFTEMINGYTLVLHPEKAWELLQIENEEKPVAVQLFGSDENVLSDAAKILEKKGVDYIDLNVGCPVKKVVKTGAGSALLKNREKLFKIVRRLRDTIKNAKFSVKIRMGWDDKTIVFTEVGKEVERIGVDFITMHARTRAEGFSGNAHWDAIRLLKESVKIPVVGNGDIKSYKDAYKMVEETGVDAVMIGREAIGRPYIFEEILQMREIKLNREEEKEFLFRYYEKKIDLYGERKAILLMRKIVPFLIKGWDNAKERRIAINRADNMTEIVRILS